MNPCLGINDFSIQSLPGRKPLLTLRDAATYITSLPKAEQQAPQWQTTAEMLMLVAERGGDTMMPRIAMMKALHRHHIREFDLDRKPHHWGKRTLKRDE